MSFVKSLMGRRQFLAGALATSALGMASKITGISARAAGVLEKAGLEGLKGDHGVPYSKIIKTDMVVLGSGSDIGGLHADLLISSEESNSIEWTIASGMCAGENSAAYVHGNRPVQVYEFPKYTARDVMAGNYENVGTIDINALPAGPPPSGEDKSYH